jgi:aminoglycoside phosphotransferase (APT) family kinase protein
MKSLQSYQAFLKQKHNFFTTPTYLIHQLIKRHIGSPISSLERIIEGEVNEVYTIQTQKDAYILKINRDSTPLFQKAIWGQNEAKKASLPTAKVLGSGTITDQNHTLSYFLQEKLPGISLYTFSNKHQKKSKLLAKQAGKLLANLHTIPTQGFGWLDTKGHGCFDGWEEYFFSELKDYRQEYLTLAHKYGIDKQLIISYFLYTQHHQHYLKESHPMLLHGDFRPKNILVHKGQISGIVDFDSISAGSPLHDLAVWDFFTQMKGIEANLPLEWLLEGYFEDSNMPAHFYFQLYAYKIRLELYFLQLYARYNHRFGLKHTVSQLKKDLIKFENYLPTHSEVFTSNTPTLVP